MTEPIEYNPGFVGGVTGYGQDAENPAPPLFLESIAIDKDLSVGGSIFSTNNLIVGASAAIIGGLTAAAASFGGARFSGSAATIGVPVTINADTTVKGLLKTDNLEVHEVEFRAVRLPGIANYYVLASYVPPQTLSATSTVSGYLRTDNLEVDQIEFNAVRLPGLDNYYVLASYIPPSDGNT